MAAYYNEIDPFAAQWLRNLIAAGHIADGDVDTRSIEDVKSDDIKKYTQCHFFAGIGVWSYALRNAGWSDDKSVWTGSCPCQPFSNAGKANGFSDDRHLWPYFFHLISECRPSVIFGEQVANKGGLSWFDLVQADLEAQNYISAAIDLCAAGFGLPHIRQRLFWVGYSDREGIQGLRKCKSVIFQKRRKDEERYTLSPTMVARVRSTWKPTQGADKKTRMFPSDFGKRADGITNRVGKLRAYGNSIAAPVAEEFIKAFLKVLNDE
ncbi:TPA: DNA cytosine methyltransferase [Proteus mirabilis]|nr:DNA cytosine methyltransferase [Proteus mirabilis]